MSLFFPFSLLIFIQPFLSRPLSKKPSFVRIPKDTTPPLLKGCSSKVRSETGSSFSSLSGILPGIDSSEVEMGCSDEAFSEYVKQADIGRGGRESARICDSCWKVDQQRESGINLRKNAFPFFKNRFIQNCDTQLQRRQKRKRASPVPELGLEQVSEPTKTIAASDGSPSVVSSDRSATMVLLSGNTSVAKAAISGAPLITSVVSENVVGGAVSPDTLTFTMPSTTIDGVPITNVKVPVIEVPCLGCTSTLAEVDSFSSTKFPGVIGHGSCSSKMTIPSITGASCEISSLSSFSSPNVATFNTTASSLVVKTCDFPLSVISVVESSLQSSVHRSCNHCRKRGILDSSHQTDEDSPFMARPNLDEDGPQSKKVVLEKAQAAWKDLSAQELRAWQIVLAAENSRRWELWQRRQMYIHLRDEVHGGLYRASKWLKEQKFEGDPIAAVGEVVDSRNGKKELSRCRRHTCERNARRDSHFCSDRCGVMIANYELFGAVNMALNKASQANNKKKAKVTYGGCPPKFPEAMGANLANRAKRIACARQAVSEEKLQSKPLKSAETNLSFKLQSSLSTSPSLFNDADSVQNNQAMLIAKIDHFECVMVAKENSVDQIQKRIKSTMGNCADRGLVVFNTLQKYPGGVFTLPQSQMPKPLLSLSPALSSVGTETRLVEPIKDNGLNRVAVTVAASIPVNGETKCVVDCAQAVMGSVDVSMAGRVPALVSSAKPEKETGSIEAAALSLHALLPSPDNSLANDRRENQQLECILWNRQERGVPSDLLSLLPGHTAEVSKVSAVSVPESAVRQPIITNASGGGGRSLGLMAASSVARKQNPEELAWDALGWKKSSSVNNYVEDLSSSEGHRRSSRKGVPSYLQRQILQTEFQAENRSYRATGSERDLVSDNIDCASHTHPAFAARECLKDPRGNECTEKTEFGGVAIDDLVVCPLCRSCIPLAHVEGHVNDCTKNALRTRRTSRRKKTHAAANTIVSRGEISVGHMAMPSLGDSRNAVECEKLKDILWAEKLELNRLEKEQEWMRVRWHEYYETERRQLKPGAKGNASSDSSHLPGVSPAAGTGAIRISLPPVADQFWQDNTF